MNRRKFLAFLAATPLAAVLPTPKIEPVFKHTVVSSPKILVGDQHGYLTAIRASEEFNKAFSAGDFVSLNIHGEVVPVSDDNPVLGFAISDED